MRNVKYSFAMGTRKLDLGRIDPLRRQRPRRRRRRTDELRRKHLREAASGAGKFGEVGGYGEDCSAAGASDLETGWGRGRKRRRS